jgi:hypothetical protein
LVSASPPSIGGDDGDTPGTPKEMTMTEDQIQAWKAALAAKNARQRRQQYRPRARGVQAIRGAGMVRLDPARGQDRTKPRGKAS